MKVESVAYSVKAVRGQFDRAIIELNRSFLYKNRIHIRVVTIITIITTITTKNSKSHSRNPESRESYFYEKGQLS
jgi:N-formylglutamate amidohydrolase